MQSHMHVHTTQNIHDDMHAVVCSNVMNYASILVVNCIIVVDALLLWMPLQVVV